MEVSSVQCPVSGRCLAQGSHIKCRAEQLKSGGRSSQLQVPSDEEIDYCLATNYQGRPAAPPTSVGTEYRLQPISPTLTPGEQVGGVRRKGQEDGERKEKRGEGHLLPSVSSEGRSTPSFLSSTGGSWEGMTESCKKTMVSE